MDTNIKKQRKELGLSQAKAGKKALLHQSRWSVIEMGDVLGVDPETQKRIAKALGTEVKSLFDENGQPLKSD